MKSTKKPKFNSFGFYILRTTKLAIPTHKKLNSFVEKHEIWNYLKEQLKDPEILDAIYIASETLFNQFIQHRNQDYSPKLDKITSTLFRYFCRMATRPTPYGKFAGVSIGTVSEQQTKVKLDGLNHSYYNLDAELVQSLIKQTLNNPLIKADITYYSNTTLFKYPNKYRYITFQNNKQNSSFQWAWIARNPLLEKVIESANKGCTFYNIVSLLQKVGIDQNKGEKYINDLILSKILISELEYTTIGLSEKSKLAKLVKTANPRKLPYLNDIYITLDSLLENLNSKRLDSKDSLVRDKIKKLNIDYDKNLLHVDTKTSTINNNINKALIANIAKDLKDLAHLNEVNMPPSLEVFSDLFYKKYGDREIPLLQAIDQERGVGYGLTSISNIYQAPLLNGLDIHNEKIESTNENNLRFIFERYWASNPKLTDKSIEITEEDIYKIQIKKSNKENNMPVAFYVLGNLLCKNDDSDADNYRFNLVAGGGASALPLLSRFSYLDHALETKLKECAEIESQQYQNCILAEIVFMPQNKAANILARPNLFKYEIPIIGQSNVSEEYRIPLDDLVVSVKNKKILLRSKRLNREIIPRLSSAHNYQYGMVVYRFLCDLQHQYGSFNFNWDWQELSTLPFTPRVTYKHIILTRARWNILKIDKKSISRSETMLKIREKYQLPKNIVIAEGDNELTIDISKPIGAEILVNKIEKGNVIVYENIYEEYQSPVKDTNGEMYANEIIIPLKTGKTVTTPILNEIPTDTPKRIFPPGTEWTYIKIYSGAMDGERLLRKYIPQLIEKLKKTHLITKWYFVRYNDPDQHIRLRLLLTKKDRSLPFQEITDEINYFFLPLIELGKIHRIVYDTYEREIERYGVDTIELCESIFHLESEAIIELLPIFQMKKKNNYRWLAGMIGADIYMSFLGFDISDKLVFATKIRDAFLIEFAKTSKLSYKLDVKYREYRSLIVQHLSQENELANKFQSLFDLENIKNSQKIKDKGVKLLPSLIHMFINRLFITQQREHEMVIYHFLVKYYLFIKNKKIKP